MVLSRFVFCCFLSILIVFTGGPFQLYYQALAESNLPQNNSEEQTDPEQEMREAIEQLKRSITSPEQGEALLDPFQILRQRTIDDRREKLGAIETQYSLEDYNERLSDLERRLLEIDEMKKKVSDKIALLNPIPEQRTHVEIDQFSELTLIAEDIDSRAQLTLLEIEDLKQFDPRAGNKLPVDFMIDQALKTKHYWGNRLSLLIEQQGQVIHEVRQREFTESMSPSFDKANPIEGLSRNGDVTFTLATPKGTILNQFLIPVEALFFFGHYIIFIEKESLSDSRTTLPIRFIDLNYFKSNIGNAPLPVYTLPLNITETPTEFAIEKGYLKVGAQHLSYQQFAMLAQVQQLVFNVNVALVDPKSYENVRPLIEEITEFFKKSMKHQDFMFQEMMQKAISSTELLKDLTDSLEQKQKVNPAEARPLIEKALADGKLSDSEYESIKKALDMGDGLTEANSALYDSRKFFTRLELLMRYLIQPRPEGSPKLFTSLALLATGTFQERARTLEMKRDSIAFKMAKYGLATGGIILAGTQLPEPYTLNMYKSMDLISAISQHFQGYLSHINYGKAYLELSKDAFITSTTGWTYFIQAYFADGHWAKFLYGLGNVLLVPLKVFGSIHMTINSYKMLTKTLEVKRLSNNQLGFLAAFKQAASVDNKAYWESLAEAEKKVSGSSVTDMTAEEMKLLDDHIQRLRSGRESLNVLDREIERGKISHHSALRGYFSVLQGYKRHFNFGSAISRLFGKTADEMQMKDVTTLRTALANTFLSYSSLRSTFKANAIIWNYLFITRSYVFSPAKWLMYLIYPNYFNVTISTNEGRQHVPTRFNSGLELWPQKIQRVASTLVQNTGVAEWKGIDKLFISKEALRNLRAFENHVAPMETIAIEIAKKRAQKALVESVKDPARVLTIFDSGERPNDVSTGIRNLHDKKIKELTHAEKVFYRAYFTRTFDLVMQGFVSLVNGSDINIQVDPQTFARQFMRALRRGEIEPIEPTESKIKLIEAEIEKIIDFDSVKTWSEQVSRNARSFFDRLDIQFRHRLLESIHPKNPQIQRFLTVKKKVEEPRAMERAMRMEVSSLFSSIPLGILTTLALYAGVESGIIMPFDPEGMNTETHFKYMSRYMFYNGFIPGLLIGLLANTWMKVQEDARIDSMGGFDKAIKYSDGKKGFWRFYLKNFFKNPNNKWADNHIYMLKLITANIPAAAVTIIVSNLYGLGRIDVGTFIAGYIMVYATFLTGFGVKMGQAFELASSWVYNKIPRKLRASAAGQKYISGNLQKRKIMFTYFENIWGILVDENIAGTMLTLKDNLKYGTRAFLRLVFGGDTPTQIIVNFADRMIETFKGVPGMESSLEMVKQLFSRNYEAFERFPEELIKQGDKLGIQRVNVDPNLPNHALGAFIGKSLGAISTIGLFAALPYIGTNALQKRREARLQKQGKLAQESLMAHEHALKRQADWLASQETLPESEELKAKIESSDPVSEEVDFREALHSSQLRCSHIFTP